MKIHLLYGGVVCIICIFTVLIFFDFRNQVRITETFRQAIHDSHLIVRHLLISPKQLKVEDWRVGDSSVYSLRTNSETKTITFQVASESSKDNNRFWLRTLGLVEFNEIDAELWRLLNKTNIRPGAEKRGFLFSHNAVPFPLFSFGFPQNPVILEKLGDEIVVTPIGDLRCEHAFAYVRAPNGALKPLLELWTNPTVRPLGLVRARWQDASLDLIHVDTKGDLKIPPVLLEEFDRDTPHKGVCTRCHTQGIGGKDLKFKSLGGLNGEVVNITTGLFHHRQAEMVKTDDLINLKLTEKSRRVRKKTSVRFSWENGSFWIKPDKWGELMFSLDANAHQGNITVQPSIGRLDLEIKQ